MEEIVWPEGSKHRLDDLFNAFEIVADGSYVYLCDIRNDISRWSDTAVSYFNLPGRYMKNAGGIWEEHIHPEDRDSYHQSIENIFSGRDGGHDMQYRARDRQGNYVLCTCKGVVMKDIDGNPTYFGGAIKNHGVYGHIDTSTGLRNQYGFFEDLDTCLLNKKKVTLMMIGLSRFTEINDIYGYDFGNSVLQRFGRSLHEIIGNKGSVYRLDGTKFAILSRTMDLDSLDKEYRQIQEKLAGGMKIDERGISLVPVAGALELDNFEVDNSTIYSCLNYAYGESKNRHQGDLVIFGNTLSDDNRRNLERFNVIRESVTHDFDGFLLYYQPIVNSHTEVWAGAEALIRWQNEDYGMVPPDTFIPLLERDALFPKLGRWILWRGMTDCRIIAAKDPEFLLNINLSYAQLEKADFADMVVELAKETGCPPQNVCLEITERCRFLDTGMLENIMYTLKGHGFKFALDDFGTGYSSLDIMKKLPFDTIKVDRAFVRHVTEDEQDKQLVSCITEMISIFGCRVCVEGIETEEMRDFLQQLPVSSFQGYLYSKPIPFGEFRRHYEI